MSEIHLVLSLQAMESLADGQALRVPLDGDTVIYVRADETTVGIFQQHVHDALMNLLPVSNTRH